MISCAYTFAVIATKYGCTRGIYSLAARGFGPNPKIFKQIDSETNMPTNSSILGLLLCGIWL
ncbi:hypothetical protein [Clostridium sp.]|uniref:hypothetical protein n=1 Tax=Clostridium sp. TaxID=1506 RepID=UPI003D6CAC26